MKRLVHRDSKSIVVHFRKRKWRPRSGAFSNMLHSTKVRVRYDESRDMLNVLQDFGPYECSEWWIADD